MILRDQTRKICWHYNSNSKQAQSLFIFKWCSVERFSQKTISLQRNSWRHFHNSRPELNTYDLSAHTSPTTKVNVPPIRSQSRANDDITITITSRKKHPGQCVLALNHIVSLKRHSKLKGFTYIGRQTLWIFLPT